MKVCILGDNLTSLALAKALVKKEISVDIPLLTKAFAKARLVKPSPRIQTFIIILILTTKIR